MNVIKRVAGLPWSRGGTYLALVAVLGGGMSLAHKAQAGDYVSIYSEGFNEECRLEGSCVYEERRELYSEGGSYEEECLGEGCSWGEQQEIACQGKDCSNMDIITHSMRGWWCEDGFILLEMDSDKYTKTNYGYYCSGGNYQ